MRLEEPLVVECNKVSAEQVRDLVESMIITSGCGFTFGRVEKHWYSSRVKLNFIVRGRVDCVNNFKDKMLMLGGF